MQETIEHDPVLAAIAANGRASLPEEKTLPPAPKKNGGRDRHPLDDRGVSIPEELRLALRNVRISAWRSVSIARQTAGYVVRGTESGGAVVQIGHYVTFAAEDGSSLEWLHPQDSIAPNQTHAVVVAPSLVRVEVFRLQRNYDLAITRHTIQSDGGKPRLLSSMLFRGRGFLGLELWDRDQAFRGSVLPAFYTRGGEESVVPKAFQSAARAAIEGVCCIACRDSHYLRAQRNNNSSSVSVGGAS